MGGWGEGFVWSVPGSSTRTHGENETLDLFLWAQ